jgi:hypothetical protein
LTIIFQVSNDEFQACILAIHADNGKSLDCSGYKDLPRRNNSITFRAALIQQAKAGAR